jgi:hypothetical protein
MQQTYFTSSSGINNYLLPTDPITNSTVLDAVFNDPFYGLNNSTNYAHWQTFGLAGSEPEIVNKRIAWATEVCFYFGLSKGQVETMYNNWNSLYTQTYNVVKKSWPSLPAYQNSVGCAYWQWADSWMTQPSNMTV